MNIKTEKLKKLEAEMRDLQQWLKLGLVPKKDLTKHEEEIKNLQDKIKEENERIKFLKESGDLEELYTSRKSPSRNQSLARIFRRHRNPRKKSTTGRKAQTVA